MLRVFCCVTGVGVLDGILYAVGGHDGPLVRKSVEAFNPETNVWTPVADMAMCRRNAGNSCNRFIYKLLIDQDRVSCLIGYKRYF